MKPGIEEQAALDFVLALRRRWADRLYPALARQVADGPNDGDFAARVHATPIWPWFAWIERGSQKMLWRAVSDAVGDAHEPAAPAAALPDWYTRWDIHLQPGGVWSGPRAAAVYELGAKLVMLGENDDYRFHHLFADTAIPDGTYRTIVDLGCGFGKSAWPLKQRFPAARVIGIDLSQVCLALAREKSAARGLAIDYLPGDATMTALPDGSADLVTSTMLLHELPIDVMERLYPEVARLLAPGGRVRFLDFHLTGDPLRDQMILEHGDRNNEPYLPPALQANQVAMAEAAGLRAVRWRAFDERSAGLLDNLVWPERPEWHFPWAVLEAERPA